MSNMQDRRKISREINEIKHLLKYARHDASMENVSGEQDGNASGAVEWFKDRIAMLEKKHKILVRQIDR